MLIQIIFTSIVTKVFSRLPSFKLKRDIQYYISRGLCCLCPIYNVVSCSTWSFAHISTKILCLNAFTKSGLFRSLVIQAGCLILQFVGSTVLVLSCCTHSHCPQTYMCTVLSIWFKLDKSHYLGHCLTGKCAAEKFKKNFCSSVYIIWSYWQAKIKSPLFLWF